MRLTPHFTLEELYASDKAREKGIDNTPPDDLLPNAMVLADGLERVRSILQVPMHSNSAYRSPKLNSAVGGSQTSDHMKFLACDFVAPMYGSPLEVAKKLVQHKEEIGFKQLIMEHTWVHVSFPDDDEEPKLQVLTAHFVPGQKTTYTEGLA